MNQTEQFQPAARMMLGEIVPPSQMSEGGIFLPGNVASTRIWKVLRVGSGFVNFPNLKAGDHVIPEAEHPILLDKKRLSLIHEKQVFAMTPGMTSQVRSLTLAPKFVLAKRIEGVKQTEAGIHIPENVKKGPIELQSSFWSVVAIGPGLEAFASLGEGDWIAPQKHAKVTLDRQEYAVVHEDWILGHLPKP